MQDKCLNYKFLLLILFPLGGIILSLIFLYLIPNKGFFLFVFVLSILDFGLLICFEPIFYIINESEIRIICAFKQYYVSYKEIQQIVLMFDVFFDFLLIEDYVLSIDMRIKIPKRCRRIFKCSKTKKLMDKYYNEKVKI